MAINKNHEFEELDGVKCGIVEKNVSPERVEFLKKILEYNKFTVVVVPSPPPKVAPAPVVKVAEASPPARAGSDGEDPAERGEIAPPPPPPPPPPAPSTFTVGVTDYTYNTINAIYGRLLKTPDGHVVTMAYWLQKENVSHDEIPYYETKN